MREPEFSANCPPGVIRLCFLCFFGTSTLSFIFTGLATLHWRWGVAVAISSLELKGSRNSEIEFTLRSS